MLTQRSRTYISSAGQPRSGRPLWAFVTRARPSVGLYLSVRLCVNLAVSLSASARRGSARPHGPSRLFVQPRGPCDPEVSVCARVL